MIKNRGFWIHSPRFDMAWIVGPHFYAVLLALLIYPYVKDIESMALWTWFVLVLCIDVSHVYSTLFRVYLDKIERQRYWQIGWIIPLGVWVFGVLLYSIQSLLFWRCLAYLAVFHFIRQQYGFSRIYKGRIESTSLFFKIFNQYGIYFITVIPVLIWHCTGPKHFNWFVEDDFIYFHWSSIVSVLNSILIVSIFAFVITEALATLKNKKFNWPRNGIYLGTLLVWYLGIAHFNNDIIFTLTNVIAHGVPYMALIWSYKARKQRTYGIGFLKANNILVFVGFLFILAYVEEFLWSTLVWKEHLPVFFIGQGIHLFELNPFWFTFLVPLLAVPQGTHYILDAFIWKIADSKRNQWVTEGTQNE